MKTYVKIMEHPNKKEAIKALEKVALDTPEVCIMTSLVDLSGVGPQGISDYFSGNIPTERCLTIASKSGEGLGEYDFYYDWFFEPSKAVLDNLNEKITQQLNHFGVKYQIDTK
jgi:hypothetical protein